MQTFRPESEGRVCSKRVGVAVPTDDTPPCGAGKKRWFDGPSHDHEPGGGHSSDRNCREKIGQTVCSARLRPFVRPARHANSWLKAKIVCRAGEVAWQRNPAIPQPDRPWKFICRIFRQSRSATGGPARSVGPGAGPGQASENFDACAGTTDSSGRIAPIFLANDRPWGLERAEGASARSGAGAGDAGIGRLSGGDSHVVLSLRGCMLRDARTLVGRRIGASAHSPR